MSVLASNMTEQRDLALMPKFPSGDAFGKWAEEISIKKGCTGSLLLFDDCDYFINVRRTVPKLLKDVKEVLTSACTMPTMRIVFAGTLYVIQKYYAMLAGHRTENSDLPYNRDAGAPLWNQIMIVRCDNFSVENFKDLAAHVIEDKFVQVDNEVIEDVYATTAGIPGSLCSCCQMQ